MKVISVVAALRELLAKMEGSAAPRESVTHLKGCHWLLGKAGPPDHIRRPQSDPLSVKSTAGRKNFRRSRATSPMSNGVFGYRRLFTLLRRYGEPSGVNRIYRFIGRKVLPLASEKLAGCRRHACTVHGRSEGQRPLVAGLRA